MNSATLNVSIKVDDEGSKKVKGFGSAVDDVGKKGQKSFKGMREEVDKLNKFTGISLTSLLKLGGISFAGTHAGLAGLSAGIVALVSQSGAQAREMENLSRLAQMNSVDFQNAAFATSQYGIQADKLADISKDVQDKLGDFIATGGGEFKDFFENIAPKVGLTAKELQGLAGPDVLVAVKTAMDQANVSAEEQVFYMEAIANDAALLTPLLEDNGKALKEQAERADQLGIAISSVDSQKLIEAQQKTLEVQAAIGGLKNHIAATLAPAVTDLGEKLLTAMADGGGGVDDLAVTISDKLLGAIGYGVEGLRFFHNGWLGIKLVGTAAIDAIAHSVEFLYSGLRTMLAPLDLAMEGFVKLGVIDVNPFDGIEQSLSTFSASSRDVTNDVLSDITKVNAGYDSIKDTIDEYRKSIVASGDDAEIAATKQTDAVNTVAANTITANDGRSKSDAEAAARMAKTQAELSAKRMAVDGEYIDSWQSHAERQTTIDKTQKDKQKDQQGELASFMSSSYDTVARRFAANEDLKTTVAGIAKDTLIGYASEWAGTAIDEILGRHGAEIGANVALGTAQTSTEGDGWQQKIATGAGYLAAATGAVYAGKLVGDTLFAQGGPYGDRYYASGGYFDTNGSGLINQGSGMRDDVFLGYTDNGATRNWGMRDEYAFIVNQERTKRFLPVLDAMNYGDDNAIHVAFNNVFRASGGPVGDAWGPTRDINDAGFDTFWDSVIKSKGDWWGAVGESIGYYAGTGGGMLAGKAIGKEVFRAHGGPIGDRGFLFGGFLDDVLDPGGILHDSGDTADDIMDVWAGGDPGSSSIWNDIAPIIGWNDATSPVDSWFKDKVGVDPAEVDWGYLWNLARDLPIVGETVERADKILYPFVRDAITPGTNPNWTTVENMLEGAYQNLGNELATWVAYAGLDPVGGLGGGIALGSYETGTDYVPKTGPYLLHQGESVKTAEETAKSRNKQNIINIFIDGKPLRKEIDYVIVERERQGVSGRAYI